MTSNIQLENYIDKHHKALGNQLFQGVVSSDELPKSNVKNGCFISNYSPQNKLGTHWVAMRDLNTAMPKYFDSYGLHPDQADELLGFKTGFSDYLRSHSTTGDFDWNKTDLQSWDENSKDDDVCGEWSIWFILHGLPDINNPAWRPFLTEKDNVKRDEMIRRRLGIVKG